MQKATSVRTQPIKYIVIHYTAGVTSRAGSAKNLVKYYSQSTTRDVSSDYVVDDMGWEKYNNDIKRYYTWHCGGSRYKNRGGSYYGKCTNGNSIGIEVCSTNNTGKMQNANDSSYSFTQSAVTNTVELTKKLMKEYNIPAENVIRHYDVTGKLCPGIFGWNIESGSDSAWRLFKKRIASEETVTTVPETEKEEETSTPTTFLVKVAVDVLNVRSGPGTSYKINRTVKRNEVYTIVETNGNWGKLKSGAGWINISSAYCERL